MKILNRIKRKLFPKNNTGFLEKKDQNRLEDIIRENPGDLTAWIGLIQDASLNSNLAPRSLELVKSHEITPNGHAVNAFADQIVGKIGFASLNLYAQSPLLHLDDVVAEIVRWKTAIQCGHSHDVSKGYFHDAEKFMDVQWGIIYPLIKDLNFESVLDLACGHGRNGEYLREHTKKLYMVDINQSCIDACKERFGNEKDGTKFFYYVTDGNHLRMIPDSSISLVYSWDSMVHFDKLIVRDYLQEIKRILIPGGSAFLHHSNYGAISPNSDWAHNVGTRSDMSADLMKTFASEVGLDVSNQFLQGRKEGWGLDDLDCVSILRRT
jgi:SAM-dependent methyltransferase